MTDRPTAAAAAPGGATALLVLENGEVLAGRGLGATGTAVGEVCFNTAMTGYQEVLTDPSYAGQIITFTFPHIGNVGINDDDREADRPFARGLVLREEITAPSNWRAGGTLNDWLASAGLVGISGIDTRALTRHIRRHGAPRGIVAHNPSGAFDIPALRETVAAWPGLEGMELAGEVTCPVAYDWHDSHWRWPGGFGAPAAGNFHVVAVDYGIKKNILRSLVAAGCRVTVVPATTPAEDILGRAPDGIFLSNGPGDPAATGQYALPVIRALLASGLPIFGICLGHQLLALAVGGATYKMHQGHRGANHPVRDLATGKVEITAMNHGFSVDGDSLPAGVGVSHRSLFDGSVCGLDWADRPVFSVQHHPEASPGPEDSHYLFGRFVAMMADYRRRRSAGGGRG